VGGAARRYDAVLFDAGSTLVYLDYARVAKLVGHACLGEAALRRGERAARAEADLAVQRGARHGTQWHHYMSVVLETAGMPAAEVEPAVAALFVEHLRRNLWRRVPADVPWTLTQLAACGYVLGVVSNAEGTVETLLGEVGLAPYFRFVLDSFVVGLEKPDPRIFLLALERAGTAAERTLFIGDSYAIDVCGARSAGLDAALIDPLDLYTDADCLRLSTLSELPAVLDGRAPR
jgi:HAD superfamily hydrolase (TIGR01509 family)